MRIKSFSAFAFLLFLWISLSNAAKEPNNPPTAKTGAPGETTCSTASNCHTGGSFTGTVTLTGLPDTVKAGQTYTLTLTQTSNASKAGFEMVCLDGANANCGAFTAPAGSGVSIGTAGTKKYPRQSAPKTIGSSGSAAWTFTWKAPTTASGNKAVFYFATLCANGNNQKTLDNTLTGEKSAVLSAISPVKDAAREAAVILSYNTASEVLNIRLAEAASGKVYLFNLNGNLLFQENIGENAELRLEMLPSGVYLAHIEAEGKKAVRKFVKD